MNALGIVVLFLSGYGAKALNLTSWARCRVYPDPHFTTVRHAKIKILNISFAYINHFHCDK